MDTADRLTTADDAAQRRERNRALLNTYLDALLANGDYRALLAEGVAFTLMDTGDVTRGRDAVAGLIDYLHRQAFDATIGIRDVVVDGGHATMEGVFNGRHAGEFAGIGATGRQISIPYVAAYDIDNGAITEIRIYLPIDAMIRQIHEG